MGWDLTIGGGTCPALSRGPVDRGRRGWHLDGLASGFLEPHAGRQRRRGTAVSSWAAWLASDA
eukprot:1026370-Heterocapsa_arctica.AAC.1